MIFFGESSLRKAVQEFVLHYHLERNHQGLGNRLIIPKKINSDPQGAVECRERLGGLLKYYYRAAAWTPSAAPNASRPSAEKWIEGCRVRRPLNHALR
jgi:hypothetical protein